MASCSPNANGYLCCGPGVFITVAFALSVAATSVCNFLRVDDDNALRGSDFNMDTFGFRCYQTTSGKNLSYGSRWEDLYKETNDFEVARALGWTGNILGLVTWIFFIFAACLPYPPAVFICVGFICLLIVMFEGFKFWLLRSSFCDSDLYNGCSLDAGGRCSIAACVFWFVSALLCCAVAKNQGDSRKKKKRDDDDDHHHHHKDHKKEDKKKEKKEEKEEPAPEEDDADKKGEDAEAQEGGD